MRKMRYIDLFACDHLNPKFDFLKVGYALSTQLLQMYVNAMLMESL